MNRINLDEKWIFRRGLLDSLTIMDSDPGVAVDLPHDGMIGTNVSKDAPAQMDMGYFTGDLTNYTKYVMIPAEWEDECVGLKFDGAMLNATVEINGSKVCQQHYGYAPFYVDLTDYVTFGAENRITVNLNTSMQPNSRWYTGSGLYRGVSLVHGPRVHIANDGIYLYTKEVSENKAFLEALIDVENKTLLSHMAEVEVSLASEDDDKVLASSKRVIQINSCTLETARLAIILDNPILWDVDTPNLYNVHVKVTDMGVYRTHFIENEVKTVDEDNTFFGVRTITADAVRGLRINGKAVKLKGGCLHHDNGLLGAVSLYEAEARKVKKLKEVGFNAIRTTHNPPSAALIEACDRLGLYVFDEAFDAWGIAKRGGDYNQFFDDAHEKDLISFVRRDRIHPSVIIWSTGNEIPERGGLNNGYTKATKLANIIRNLDSSRPVSNGICSMWSGLDDYLARNQSQAQNSNEGLVKDLWEKVTEPFTNGLDIVGYNYMEDIYERDHELFPERVILGSENFPKEIGYRWPMVERLPYVIGDFTWTAWDYLGEAGIGKGVYVDADDPAVEKGPWALMPQATSMYPWRTANDADYDITGRLLPQGEYRSVVWGSSSTHLYSMHPDTFGKTEVLCMWGFPYVNHCWNYEGYEGKPVELVVFSNADEVELIVNGQSIGRKAVGFEKPMPNTVSFETVYQPGVVEAISYKNGQRISSDTLETSGAPATIKLNADKEKMISMGHELIYVDIDIVDENGKLVTDASVDLTASVTGTGYLAGFGTGNPITEENYTDNKTTTYRGHATLIVRSSYEKGSVKVSVSGAGLPDSTITLEIV